jgi:hypothetical protein
LAPRRPHREVPSRRRGEKHGWLSFDRYRAIHEGALQRHPFVLEDRTSFRRILDDHQGAAAIELIGVVRCLAGITIDIRKLLETREVRRVEQVRGYLYSYNAHLPGRFNLLRYDNAHADSPDEYHRHSFDVETGLSVAGETLTREEFPTLIEVVAEVQALALDVGLI